MSNDLRIVTNSWQLEDVADPPDDSVVGTPARRPQSIRRTAHLSASWPSGYGTPMHMTGRARDLVTSRSGVAVEVRTDELKIELDQSHTVRAVSALPHRPAIEELVGTNGIRGFRSAVDTLLPDERSDVSPLSFLLDDVPAITMVGGTAWAQHRSFDIPASQTGNALGFQRTGSRRIACSGLRPDGYYEQSLERGITFPHFVRLAGNIDSDDPWAWHQIEPAPAICFRRRRRIDAWTSGGLIEIDVHFRDSMWGPAHDEIALHEYTVTATIYQQSRTLDRIEVKSRVLPFPECPAATEHVGRLAGSDVSELRTSVQEVLSEFHACTHLNDLFRGLSAVPALVGLIDRSPQ